MSSDKDWLKLLVGYSKKFNKKFANKNNYYETRIKYNETQEDTNN